MELGAVEHLEVLSRDECLALIARVPVGRLGVSIQALPAILPVNFALLGDRIFIRSVPDTKLDAATAQNVVAFEVDGYDPAGSWGWSVLVRGVASEITDPADLAKVRALPLRAWGFNDAADRFLAIEATLVSGRTFGR